MGVLDGKIAIITGGVGGIGNATARLFVEEGARVVIADIADEKGNSLAEILGERATYLRTDVSKEADIEAAVDLAVSRFGRLDCMFNNAGIPGTLEPIDKISVEGFDDMIGVHLRGVFLGMKHAAPIMKHQRSGSIINTSSIAGISAGHGSHSYSAAKAAVIHLTRSVAMELGESGIRVNCICPGGIATPIFGRAFGLSEDAADKTVSVMKTVLQDVQPIKRSGLPEDIARAALWLAGDDSGFVNGHALVVDGGITGGRLWTDSQERWALLRLAMNP